MAGRPAPISSGRSPLLYWLIAFVIVWVVTLTFLILQFTSNQQLVSDAQLAKKSRAEFGDPPPYYRDEAAQRKSNVAAVMKDDLRKLAGAVTGTPEDVAPEVLRKSEALLTDISGRTAGGVNPGDTLLTALEKVDRLRADARLEADANQKAKKDLEADKDSLTKQLKSATDTFEQQVGELNRKLTSAREEHLEALRQKDAQLRDMEDQIKTLTTQIVSLEREGTTVARDKDIEIGRMQTIVNDLQGQIRALKPSTFNPEAILSKADGRILRAVPGSDVVYINLGSAERIRAGMGFEVFAQMHRASPDLRGKASLEVVHVMEDTSECRITRRVAGEPLVEGDIVVNIAYERDRKPKFVVRGTFDLNYDGVPDFDGVEQVQALIKQWGGQIADKLDETVDFLIVGSPPAAAAPITGAPATEVVQDQARRRAAEAEAFRAEVDQAQHMYIPVITQNQFLFLIGDVRDMTVTRR